MEYTLNNSIEDVSDEENLDINLSNIPEIQPSTKIVTQRKSRFKGFFQSQKTIIFDSESSMDRPESDSSEFDKLDTTRSNSDRNDDDSSLERASSVRQGIPRIVEDLVPPKGSTEGDDSMCDDTTESDVRINKSDQSKIMKEHDNPGINTEMKASGSLVNISQGLVDKKQNHLVAENDTSDEDISELASEQPSPMPRKQRLRISLRNLSDSDDDAKSNITDISSLSLGTKPKAKRQDTKFQPTKKEDESEIATDESDLEVTDMDYYKIRHQNDTVPYVPSTITFNEIVHEDSQQLDNASVESDNDTEESDIEVTEMDYYRIRHAQDQQQASRSNVEFSLSWSPIKNACESSPFRRNSLVNNIRSFNSVNVPKYQSRDIPDGYNYSNDGDDTDGEDVPCQEDDFMTMEEFLAAHQTNFDLEKGKGESKIKIRQDSILQLEVDNEDDEDEDTESLRESLHSTDNEMEEDVSEATDISEVQTSVAENHSSPGFGEIVLMEHDDLEGTIAVYSPRKSVSYENIGKLSFKPEIRDIIDDNLDLDISEIVTEQIETDSDPDNDDFNDTDEEPISGMEIQIPVSEIKFPEFVLPKAQRKMLRISTSIDGDVCTTEKELPDNDDRKGNKKNNNEKEVDTEDEIMHLENFVMSPLEEKSVNFPEYYNHVGKSKVTKKEKTKMNRRRKVAAKKLVDYDDEPETEEL